MPKARLPVVILRLVLAVAVLTAASAAVAGSLHTAIRQGDLDLVRQAVADGADVNQEDPLFGTPLIAAAISGDVRIVAFLADQGAALNAEDSVSGTALHAAAAAGHLDAVEALIERNADIHAARFSDGETPLHAAAEGGNRAIVERLVSLGADVNARGHDRQGPIHSAGRAGHFELVTYLREQGAKARPIPPVEPLLADADPVNGGRIFSGFCGQCHTTEQGGPHRTGPNLWSIVGRPRASVPDFDYSPAFRRLDGSWSYGDLNAFIANPSDAVPGTKMAIIISIVDDPGDRADLIAYLRQYSDDPVPLPTP